MLNCLLNERMNKGAVAHREVMVQAQGHAAGVKAARKGTLQLSKDRAAFSDSLQGPWTHPWLCVRKGQTLSSPLLHPAADKGSWCEQQLCACDKEVAVCLQRNLDTYQKRLRYYWRPHCRGKTPIC